MKLKKKSSKNLKFFKYKQTLYSYGKSGVVSLPKNLVKKGNSCYSAQRCLANKILGSSAGYSIKLEIKGIGYRIETISNKEMVLKLGFSHKIYVNIPDNITIRSTKKSVLVINSPDIEKLKNFIFYLRALRPINSYKGKGILFLNEKLSLKEVKKK